MRPNNRERKCAENYNKWHAKYFFLIQTITVSECCLIKLLPHILFEKYINILALEMASRGNRHCANCIGTLWFPVAATVTVR